MCLTATLALGGCSTPTTATKAQTQTAGGLAVQMRTVPDPPHTGDNTLVLTVTEATSGAPVGNLNVIAIPDMRSPRLPGQETSGRAQGMGIYNVPIRLAVATRYAVRVRIQRVGQSAAAEFSFPIEASQ